MDAPKAFIELIDTYRFPMGSSSPHPLTNFTFFAGAGFSKSWDKRAPVSDSLFTFEASDFQDLVDPLALSRTFGIDSFGTVTADAFRQMLYHLDVNERFPDVRSRYLDDQNISMIRGGLRALVQRRFQQLFPLNFLESNAEKFSIEKPTDTQEKILAFFRHLLDATDGSGGQAEGIRTNFITTNYDYVIETILDNIHSPDDSFFLYNYRGITPRTISGRGNPVNVSQHWLSSHLLKINGGFEIVRKGDIYELNYRERSEDKIRKHPPVLMLPSREQDYSDPYFKAVFPKTVRLLRESTVLLLVGYSLPPDDALLRFIIRQFAEEPEDGLEKFIFYIDPKLSARKKLKKLKEVFPSIEDGFPRIFTFEGGFDDFVAQVLDHIPDLGFPDLAEEVSDDEEEE